MSFEIENRQSSSELAKYDFSQSPLIVRIKSVCNRRLVWEISFFSVIVIAIFTGAMIHFLNEKALSVVPSGFTSSCSKSSEIYTLAAQKVNVSFPANVQFIDIKTGHTYPFLILAEYFASWDSCGKEQVSDIISLQDDTQTKFVPLALKLIDSVKFSGIVSASSNDCFRLSCGFNYITLFAANPRENFGNYLNNSANLLIPTTTNYVSEINNGTVIITNSQTMASIIVSSQSVTGMCAFSIAGVELIPLIMSNTVIETGSYLCTKYASFFQALSSSLSIALSVIGLCRLYFGLKELKAK